MIQLSQILHNKPVVTSIPSLIKTKPHPPLATPTQKHSRQIFNLKQTIKDLDFDVGTQNLSCNCHESPFRYDPIGHVVTGNLRIVENRKLRKLLSKGPYYREQTNIKWETNLNILKKAVREFEVKWVKNEKVDARILDEWEIKVLDSIHTKITKISKKLM